MVEADLNAADAAVNRVAQDIRSRGFQAVYSAFDESLSHFEGAYRVADLLPEASHHQLSKPSRLAAQTHVQVLWTNRASGIVPPGPNKLVAPPRNSNARYVRRGVKRLRLAFGSWSRGPIVREARCGDLLSQR
jgi:hypothetical protein